MGERQEQENVGAGLAKILTERQESMKKRILSTFTVLILYFVLTVASVLTGDFGGLTDEQTDELLVQYVRLDQVGEPFESKYLPGCQIASCKLFGTEREGDYIYVYADILEETYVLFEGRAYSQSGSHMPVKLKAEEENGNLKLIDVWYPEDGDGYWESLKEMYPAKYIWKYEYCYHGSNYERLYAGLLDAQEKKIKKLWGDDVVLERDNMLDIEEDGSYRLWTAGDGSAEEFEVTVIKAGHLRDK